MILPDLLQANLNIVFCGTAPGTVSAQRGAYYANAGNAFWRTLFEVGLTPHQVSPIDFQSITKYRLGLTDLAKQVYGADSSLKKSDFGPSELREKILHHAPKFWPSPASGPGKSFSVQRCTTVYKQKKSAIHGCLCCLHLLAWRAVIGASCLGRTLQF